MMLSTFKASCLLAALARSVQAAPTPQGTIPLADTERASPRPPMSDREDAARQILGSAFGVPENRSFDYVVVGGGTAGLAVASRLAEDPSKQVAVIEAGGFYEIDGGNLSTIPAFGPAFTGKSIQDTNPLIDWNFVTTPQSGLDGQSAHYARGKCLGGSSGRNFLTYQRGSKSTYKMWADQVGDQSYEWDRFLPYFEKSLEFTPPDSSARPANATPEYDPSNLGNGKGPLSITFARYAHAFSSWVQLAFKQIGIDPIKGFTSGNILGSSYQLLTIDRPKMDRESSETSFLRQDGLSRGNLIVYESSLAKKIIFNQNKRATGVQVEKGGRSFLLSTKKEVIVSAGAFQSPQLLMVSGVGPAKTLGKHGIPIVADRPGVGQNMWDHVLGGPSYRVNVVTTSSLSNPDFATTAVKQYNEQAMGILTDTGTDLLAWEKISRTQGSNFTKSVQDDLNRFPQDWPEVEYFATSGYFGFQQNFLAEAPNDGYNYASIAIGLQAPLSRGTVDITSADMADPPVINPNWLTHPTDQAVAVAGYKRVRQIFQTQVMKPILIGPEYFPGADRHVESDAQILDFIRQSFSTVFHAACTCKMGGEYDSMAVVDRKAKVFGVRGLRVVDASAFPLLPPGHPVATIYALAEKIAEDISKS